MGAERNLLGRAQSERKLQVRLRSTYDVIPEPKQVFQETYTKRSNCRAYIDGETVTHRAQTSENQTTMKDYGKTVNLEDPTRRAGDIKFLAKGASGVKPRNLTSPKRETELLKVLLRGSSMVLKSISPESSLKDYLQAMKSTLEESLGAEMFTVVHKYLCCDVQKDLSSGVDICQPLFEALGKDEIVFLPLMLQYIQCEKNLST